MIPYSDSRTLDEGRKRQGFKSQAHLDAFFVSLEHKRGCAVCSSIGGAVPLDDGMQPYFDQCELGRKLELASFSNRFPS